MKSRARSKEHAGKLTNNLDLTAEGQAQRLAGTVQKKVGEIEKVLVNKPASCVSRNGGLAAIGGIALLSATNNELRGSFRPRGSHVDFERFPERQNIRQESGGNYRESGARRCG
jgi:hypothetical protein